MNRKHFKAYILFKHLEPPILVKYINTILVEHFYSIFKSLQLYKIK